MPAPPNFAAVFIERGWRGIERMYGADIVALNAWIEMCGGNELRRRRREAQKCGRKSGSGTGLGR